LLSPYPCTKAVYNGRLGTGFGQRFRAASDRHPPAAIAA